MWVYIDIVNDYIYRESDLNNSHQIEKDAIISTGL